MSSRIRNRQLVPKGGFTFREGDVSFQHNSLGGLMRKVRDYRIANGKLYSSEKELYIEIEAQMCAERPQLCVEADGKLTVLKQAANFAQSMIRWAAQGFPKVSEAEFNKRRDACMKCPYWKGWGDTGTGVCNTCGCVTGKVSLKLLMATEKCPDKPPRWE